MSLRQRGDIILDSSSTSPGYWAFVWTNETLAIITHETTIMEGLAAFFPQQRVPIDVLWRFMRLCKWIAVYYFGNVLLIYVVDDP